MKELTVSCDLSDFHKLVLTVLKTTLFKNKSSEINSQNFNDELKFVF